MSTYTICKSDWRTGLASYRLQKPVVKTRIVVRKRGVRRGFFKIYFHLFVFDFDDLLIYFIYTYFHFFSYFFLAQRLFYNCIIFSSSHYYYYISFYYVFFISSFHFMYKQNIAFKIGYMTSLILFLFLHLT